MTQTWVAQPARDVVRVSGKDRVDLLHRLSTNDLEPLAKIGQVRSTLFTTAQGRLIDWVDVLATDDALLVICAAGRGARVAEWIETYTIMEDVRSVVDPGWYFVVVQGSSAEAVIKQTLGASSLAASSTGDEEVTGLHAVAALESALPARGQAVRRDDVWLWRGAAAYSNRVELLVPSAKAKDIAARLQQSGAVIADKGLVELSRVVAGVPGPQGEYPDDVNPLELRLGPVAVSFRKGCYIGQEVISRLDSYDKVARLLVGFSVAAADAKNLPASPDGLKLRRDGSPFGRVTSLVVRPDGGAEGLAIVKRDGADATAAELEIADKTIPVRLERRPFPG